MASHPPRILLVDDDPLITETSKDLLKQEFPDLVIDSVHSADGFERAFDVGLPALVITDYKLGWSTGIEILSAVKSRIPECPVIMFTGTATEALAIEALKAGLDDYVVKDPMHLDRLVVSVRSVLARSEQARVVRETQARYSSLVEDVMETSPIGIFVLDRTLRVVWMNAAIERFFGVRRQEFIGKDKRQLIEQRIKGIMEAPDAFAQTILETYRRKEAVSDFECHVLAANNRKERWLEHRSVPIGAGLYAGGRSEYYQDISDRKRIEKARQFESDQFSAAFEYAAIGMALVAPDGRWLKVNRALCEMTGYSEQELLAATFQDITHPDDLALDLQLMHETLAGKRSAYQMKKRYIHKSGRIIWLLLSVSLLRKEEQPLHFIAQMQDITAQKQAEDSLQETNETLSSMIMASPLAIFTLDTSGVITSWNPAAERLFGWTKEEVLGHPTPLVTKERESEFRAYFEQLLHGMSFNGVELVRQTKDKSLVNVRIWTASFRDRKGQLAGITAMMEDITERKRMEAHAQRTEQLAAMGQLLSGVAHELRNPVFILTGRLELLQEKLRLGDTEKALTDTAKLQAAADRIVQVTERFLKISRPVVGERTQVDLVAVLNELLDFVANELMKSGITLKKDLQPNLPVIMADRHELQGAFLNLVLNAIQAMNESGGERILSVKAGFEKVVANGADGSATVDPLLDAIGGWIIVSIEDNGPGIAPEHRSKLFEPFFTTKPPGKGTGLGLWTVQSRILGLGGTVTFETEVGKGTTFIVKLPVPVGYNI